MGSSQKKSISRDTTGTLLQDDLNLLLQTPPLLVWSPFTPILQYWRMFTFLKTHHILSTLLPMCIPQAWDFFLPPIVSSWKRQWHPTLVLLSGKSHGRRSLVGCSPWGQKRVGPNWVTSLSLFTFMHWRRKWQPGESQGQQSLVGCRLWGSHRVRYDWSDLAAADLLTAEKRGLCLFLNEECCFYVNQSEIVRDMAQQLREQIIKRRKILANSWGNWSNIWSWASWLLPLTGPPFTLCSAHVWPLYSQCSWE